ncbi:MAG: hypothetical protein HUU02_15810 [Bacteroidetes bacterium]|nr:hypothetical protein [Bacteroidota bacterium]
MRRSIQIPLIILFLLVLAGSRQYHPAGQIGPRTVTVLSFSAFHGDPADPSGITFQTRKYRPRSTQSTSAYELFRYSGVSVLTGEDEASLNEPVARIVRTTRMLTGTGETCGITATKEWKLFAAAAAVACS